MQVRVRRGQGAVGAAGRLLGQRHRALQERRRTSHPGASLGAPLDRYDPARDRIITTVRDTGTGIPEDTLSRIFEPFYTTKEVGKGTGLGLAITYGIVQEHGGQILAANHPEGGAVFTVELPTAPSPRRHQDADA